MSTSENKLVQTIEELGQSAQQVPNKGDAIDWLCDLTRVASHADCSQSLALAGLAGLARTVGVTHYGLATRQGDRLVFKLLAAGGEVASESNLAAGNSRSAIVKAFQQQSPLIAENSAELGEELGSALAIQLRTSAHPFGVAVLAHYSPREWQAEEISLLEALAHQVGAAREHEDTKNELQRQNSLLETLQESMEAGVLFLSPNGHITEINAAASSMTGFNSQELIGRSVWNALLVAEDLQHVKQAFARLQREAATERFESFILTKAGDRKRVSWSISQLAGDDVAEPTTICTGVDITERCAAIERALRAEAASANARQMFAELQERIQLGEQAMDASHLARRLPPGVEVERRSRPRREYPYLQLVAPLRGKHAPTDDMFAEMLCHDISSRGFAFITTKKPDYDKVVVAFGTAPTIVYLIADVRHATPKPGTKPQQYIVGCRYTGRLKN